MPQRVWFIPRRLRRLIHHPLRCLHVTRFDSGHVLGVRFFVDTARSRSAWHDHLHARVADDEGLCRLDGGHVLHGRDHHAASVVLLPDELHERLGRERRIVSFGLLVHLLDRDPLRTLAGGGFLIGGGEVDRLGRFVAGLREQGFDAFAHRSLRTTAAEHDDGVLLGDVLAGVRGDGFALFGGEALAGLHVAGFDLACETTIPLFPCCLLSKAYVVRVVRRLEKRFPVIAIRFLDFI